MDKPNIPPEVIAGLKKRKTDRTRKRIRNLSGVCL